MTKVIQFAHLNRSSKGHTPDHKDCPGCEQGLQVNMLQVSPDLLFASAFELWISKRTINRETGFQTTARYISERTEWDYRQYARALGKFFGRLTLADIHEGHLQQYHQARALNVLKLHTGETVQPWDFPCGANRIRKEVSMLIRILVAAGLWDREEKEETFQLLQHEESDIARAASPEEQNRFLKVAASREEWAFIYHYTVAALQTTASTNELRYLRLGDVTLDYRMITIRNEGAKNKFRMRAIPLETSEVIWAFERLIERARKYGAGSPHHYLFPHGRHPQSGDPTHPMSDSGLRARWDQVRTAADMKWFRPYDLRHTGITRMAENGVPIAVIMSFAGHMSVKMQQHYTTISMMAKRKAMASTWSASPFGYGPEMGPGTTFAQPLQKRG